MKIQVKITWEMAIPLYIQAIKQGSKGRYAERAKLAEEELLRLGREVDKINGYTVVNYYKEDKPRKKKVFMQTCKICGKTNLRGKKGLGIHKAHQHGIHSDSYEKNLKYRKGRETKLLIEERNKQMTTDLASLL